MPEKILEENSSKQFERDYTRYGIYILYRRVLSDYRDGLKPVQRRILWAMFKNTKAITSRVKSAAVIGDVMKLYHPHSNCLHPDTELYCLDNTTMTIEEAYNKGIQRLDILAVDPNTGDTIPAVATNFRIGQVSNKEYRIVLSNGYVIRCTEEHPFLLGNMQWVKAKDLRPNMRLKTDMISEREDSGRLKLCKNIYIHNLVHDYYYGTPNPGDERHHIDGNFRNNIPSNLMTVTKNEHMNFHKRSERALDGLEAGRRSMFGDGKYAEKNRMKNEILMKSFNENQGIYRFKRIINIMIEQGMEITEENYETFRDKVYNLPIVSRLIARHPECGNSFEDLVNYTPKSVSDHYLDKKYMVDELDPDDENPDLIKAMSFTYENRWPTYKTFDRMLDSGMTLNIDNFIRSVQRADIDLNKLNDLINFYRIEHPYIDLVECVNVKETAYYDFTVNGVENMYIPVKTNFNYMMDGILGWHIPLICVHNSSIYGAMKPMANWFETNAPLIDAGGNFGTFQGDDPAAERYTECRLSKLAVDYVIGDLAESLEAVDWSPTYNEAAKEPDYLPVKFPMLLVNGSFGIGLGLRAEIPTHNLSEVIDATLHLMDHPEDEVVLIPDHCMKCEIFNTDFKKICKSGFGHYRIRGKMDIETYKGKTALVIKSVPNLTYLNGITDKIEDLIAKKKIIQIENCYDESTVNEMRYVIVLKTGADANYVRDVIYKNTNLEQNIRINFETLNGLNPLRMSYRSYLLSFIDHRKMTKFRVYSNRLQTIQTKIHEREAFIKVLESGEIDNIIAIIKKQKTVDDNALIEYLIKKLKITDLQARYIIDSDLKKLSYGYLDKYKQEALELDLAKNELMTHIMDDKVIENDIKQELLEIKQKYGRPRNCTIISEDAESEIPKGEMTIAITEKNFVRKVPGNSPIGNFRNDSIRTMIKIDNTDSILIFDEMGKVFKLPVHKIPFTDKNSNGTDIRFIIKSLTTNINTIIPESVCKALSEKGHFNNKHYLVTLTNAGLIKRMDLDDFTTVPPSGILYAKIDKGDFIKDIVIAHSNFNIVVYSDRKAVIMNVNDIPYQKRNTKGSKSMSNVEFVDGMCVIHNDCTDIAVITESGKVNRINLISGLPNTAKGKSGCNLIKLSNGDRIVGVVSGNERDSIHIKCTSTDTVLEFANLEIGSSISTGIKAISTRGNKILRCYVEKH